ncbi:hypothetical protein CONPUDRAFT_77050 [Coniophora puteana RWD-64-598 SS2]|uniref:Uncharacterized protein n=1 Tax=Coniophora puteana (strain RWD-64-598) TaxID=741705 RepID=A0A5M3MAY2_CONPW|nr:uncharacterized protein CONPUDRAFT_77050 [Coniophora puteana RWD-64-598 SS2]EIW76034.1 hypothetical protein CONPUDRAFT_77050 [Coniophora puteana RWD-64-598 SS2]
MVSYDARRSPEALEQTNELCNSGNTIENPLDLGGNLGDTTEDLENAQALGCDEGDQPALDTDLGDHQDLGNNPSTQQDMSESQHALSEADHARMQPLVSEELEEPQAHEDFGYHMSGWTDGDIETVSRETVLWHAQWSLAFIKLIRNASLDDENNAMSCEAVSRMRNPMKDLDGLADPDMLMCIQWYLTFPTEDGYRALCEAQTRRHPTKKVYSMNTIKKHIEELTGIQPIHVHMCPNSCLAFTSPFADLLNCPLCQKPCYNPKFPRKKVPILMFVTLPVGPQLQALWRNPEQAEKMAYRDLETTKILRLLRRHAARSTSMKIYIMVLSIFVQYRKVPARTDQDLRFSTVWAAIICNSCHHEHSYQHDDTDINSMTQAQSLYTENMARIAHRQTNTKYEQVCLDTGIVRPGILSGFPDKHILAVPYCYGSDIMHLAAFNITDKMIPLWRGTFKLDDKTESALPPDSKDNWGWTVLTGKIWDQHGEYIAYAIMYLPGSFDRLPRNPAEKISSGYKAWEFLLYFYGMCPALLFDRSQNQPLPRGTKDLGRGYILLGAKDQRPVNILPEEHHIDLEGRIKFAEVQYYFYIESRSYALVSLYGDLDQELFMLSHGTVVACQHPHAVSRLTVIDPFSIKSVVAMIPHKFPQINRLLCYLVEKPGLEIATFAGHEEVISEDE